MATHGSPSVDGAPAKLPPSIPLEIPRLTRLSWELGSRVVSDDESTLRGRWEEPGLRWELAVFRVTSATVVLKVRTPVGRERFYGAAKSDFDAAVSTLETAPSWQRVD